MGAGGWTCTRTGVRARGSNASAADALAQVRRYWGCDPLLLSDGGGGRGAGLPGWPDGAGTRLTVGDGLKNVGKIVDMIAKW